MRPLTMSEKILARVSGRPAGSVAPGDVVTARVDLVMSHDNAALIGNVFRQIPVKGVFDAGRMVVTLDVVRDVTADGANYKAVEYEGSWIDATSVPERQTLCNMGIEMGAKVAMVPPDATTLRYLHARGKTELLHAVASDEGARFAE